MSKHANKKSKKKKDTIDIDINDAIKISEKLEEFKAGTITLSEDEVEVLHKGAQLISMLVTIYSKWCTSKKKINKLLRLFFGNNSEKTSDLQNQVSSNNEISGKDQSDHNDTTGKDENGNDDNNYDSNGQEKKKR